MRAQVRTGVWLIMMVPLMLAAGDVGAQAARVSASVSDVEGNPITGVAVTVTCAAKTDYRATKVTNKRGTITVTHLDSIQTYTYEFAKEGYQTQVMQVRPDYTETTRIEVVLRPQDPTEIPTGEGRTPAAGGRALDAFNEGTQAQRQGDLALAEKKFRQAADLNPNAAEPHIALAVVAHQRGDYGAAAAEAEAALAISPNNEQAMLLRYDAYRMLDDAGKTAEAAEALRRMGSVSVAAGAVFSEGMKEYRAGNTEAAVESFRQAVELDPGLVNGYLMLGGIAVNEGDPAKAVEMVSKVLELDPGNVNALRIRYDAARILGNTEDVRRALAALIEADPQWAGTDLFNHAVELYNADDMANAASVLEKVVEVRPDDAKALFLLGMARYNLGETDDAKQHLTRFLELAPDDPDAELAREMLKYAPQ